MSAEVQITDVRPPLGCAKAHLGKGKRQCRVSFNRGLVHLACGGIHPGRHVQR
jgi:hypothetical protein